MKAAGLLLAAAAALAACVHAPPVSDGLDAATRRMRIAALPGWDMRGRIAIDTGERAFQARFRWLQRADSLVLTVRGLFGAGSFEIDGTPDALTLRARGDRWSLADPETELSSMFGWWLPVGSLDAWLLGLPDDGFEARTDFGRDGRLVALDQRLWTVEYDNYALAGGLLLPRAMDMRHGPLRLKLTVDAWSPAEDAQDALN